MASNLPKPLRIELMLRAWKLAVAGTPQLAIAEQLGISQGQVSRYLAKIARRTDERLVEVATTYRVLSIEQTDSVFHEAMQAFERSKKPKRRATKKSTSGDGSTKGATPDDSQTTTEVTEREGDPAWLATVMNAIRLRHELLPIPRAAKADDDEDKGDGTVADALLEAERRDAAYQASMETTDEAKRADQGPGRTGDGL